MALVFFATLGVEKQTIKGNRNWPSSANTKGPEAHLVACSVLLFLLQGQEEVQAAGAARGGACDQAAGRVAREAGCVGAAAHAAAPRREPEH